MSPEERAEAAQDFLTACERLERVVSDLKSAHGADTFASVPDLVDQANQCLQIALHNAVAIERGAF